MEKIHEIIYDKAELMKIHTHSGLIDDIRVRTGITKASIRIFEIDFLEHTSQVKVFYLIGG